MNERALLALLVLIAVIILVNLAIYGMVRKVIRGDTRWIRALHDTLSKPLHAGGLPMDELRHKVEALQQDHKRDTQPEMRDRPR